MTTVVVSPRNVIGFAGGGGHAWVYLQYVHGLRAAGCDVWWMEEVALPRPSGDHRLVDAAQIESLWTRLGEHGLADRLLIYRRGQAGPEWLLPDPARAEAVIAGAELLLNFHQCIDEQVLRGFARTALVDIDPGLLQVWIHRRLLDVPAHDVYLTTGETVGQPGSPIPDVGLRWEPIRPPVALDMWPYMAETGRPVFTTVTSWWGHEWMTDGGEVYDNNKRAGFMPYLDLPRRSPVPLELALNLGPGDEDDADRLIEHGWRLRHSTEVAATPAQYGAYIRGSRGEFSCVKPSCRRLANAWISDRTLCYLASGRPAVVEHTGPSAILPDREGLLRFTSPEDAADALAEAEAGWRRHSRAGRELVEAHFDARAIAGRILELCLAPG